MHKNNGLNRQQVIAWQGYFIKLQTVLYKKKNGRPQGMMEKHDAIP
jgi:hypothetical protein